MGESLAPSGPRPLRLFLASWRRCADGSDVGAGFADGRRIDLLVREHQIPDQERVGGDIDRRSGVGVDGCGGDRPHIGGDALAHRLFRRRVEKPLVAEGRGKERDRIVSVPGLQLLAGAIGAGIGGRVSGEAIGLHVEEGRAMAALEQEALALDGIGHGERVGAVDRLGVQVRRAHRDPDPRQAVPAGGLADGLAAHRIEIVGEEEEDRQPALERLRPQPVVLGHRRRSSSPPRPARSRSRHRRYWRPRCSSRRRASCRAPPRWRFLRTLRRWRCSDRRRRAGRRRACCRPCRH